ncbi:uncharacterized protein LOC108829955 [Raphanus sativus]|uniref:Uncharacterized protein LOC108829955 n=1 Tax=Raphanus sativus TaxID=3726 RepID=A0A9W3CGX3_RAPSA|nr:uncharacterized protein LOC108829955 [Raphanus sativus]
MRPDPSNSINYSSTFKTVKAVKDVVSTDVSEYVENSPLGVIIKQLHCKKRHELWFLIEEQPALFSLFEFEDITGLNCDPIPDAMVVEDVEESNHFWALFKLRRPRSTPSAEDILEPCRSPDVCRSWSMEDQIRLCYLAILTGGLLALDRREAIPPAKAKLLMDLETFEQYPWGRVAFVELVHQIKTATKSGKIKNSSYVYKGFVQVIQVWAYAYIPCVGEAIGRPISSHGILLLRFKGKSGKLSLNDTFNKAKVTCMCTRSLNEVYPVWEQQDEDPEIDNLLEFLRQHKSLSTITWQALPVYPFTPVKCNKRVASQMKSKKSKKVASSKQENTADGDNLESRIAQLEEFHQVKTLAHDRFSNTKLPAKPAILEDSIGEPSVQGIGGPQDPGKEEEKQAYKPVEEVHPDEKPGADIDEELAFEGEGIENAGEDITDGIFQNINQSYSPEEAEPSKKHDQRLLTPKEVLTDDNAGTCIDEELAFEAEGIDNAGEDIYTKKSYTLMEWEDVVYGPPADSDRTKLVNFMCKSDSIYPIGSEISASKFFEVFMQPREWLTDDVRDLTFDTYLAMVISIPNRTIKLYDSGKRTKGDAAIKKEAEPFAYMIPYALWFYAKEENKQSMDHADHLTDDNMAVVRMKLAVEMYLATTKAVYNMWDTSFLTDVIDGRLN